MILAKLAAKRQKYRFDIHSFAIFLTAQVFVSTSALPPTSVVIGKGGILLVSRQIHKVEMIRDRETIFLDHYAWLLDWALRLSRGSKEEAEDLVQDLYVRFVQSKAELDGTNEDGLR